MNRRHQPAHGKRLFWILFDAVLGVLNGTMGVMWRRYCRPFSPMLVEHLRLLRILFWFHRFDRLGTHCGVGRRVKVYGPIRLSMGDYSALYDNVALLGSGKITIGRRSTLGHNSAIACMDSIELGNNVMVAGYCYLIDLDHDFASADRPIAQQGILTAPIVIEDDVWIGAHTVVLRGVRIGRGAVIGANSVVTRDIPPYSIAVGNPARVVRTRAPAAS